MSDVKYDAKLCERLEREAREDDATIRFVDDRFARPDTAWPECGHDEATCPCFTENDKARSVLAKAMLRTRDNLRAMADQLAAARAEIERLTAERDLENRMLDKLIVAERDRLSAELALMRPVVLAAELEVDRHSSCVIAERARDPLACAVDEYRAARGKAVR